MLHELFTREIGRATCTRPGLARKLFALSLAVIDGHRLPKQLQERTTECLRAHERAQREQQMRPLLLRERERIRAMVLEERKKGARQPREAFERVAVILRTIPETHHRGHGPTARQIESIYNSKP